MKVFQNYRHLKSLSNYHRFDAYTNIQIQVQHHNIQSNENATYDLVR